MPDSNDNIPADILTLLDQLTEASPQGRYEAACALGRMRIDSDEIAFRVSHELIVLAEQEHADQRVRSALGIASSMVSARNYSRSIFYGGDIPDFLPAWEDA